MRARPIVLASFFTGFTGLSGLMPAPRGALADSRDDDARNAFTIGSRPAWFLLGGVTTGGTIALADRGALVGGELSLVRLRERTYLGAYTDAYYDWGADGTYVTLGPEIGYAVIGLDGGVAWRFAGGDTQIGATGRLSVGVGLVNIYARYAYFDAMSDDHVIQIGLAVKLPLMTLGGN